MCTYIYIHIIIIVVIIVKNIIIIIIIIVSRIGGSPGSSPAEEEVKAHLRQSLVEDGSGWTAAWKSTSQMRQPEHSHTSGRRMVVRPYWWQES